MRISDWSSDVCASDLARIASIRPRQLQHLLGEEVQDHVRADRRGSWNEHFTQQALDMIFLCVAHAAQRQHRGMAGLEREFGSEVFSGIGFDATFGVLVRSEEHTSELQSLMRISYAVLCLKKKKLKQKDTDITIMK